MVYLIENNGYYKVGYTSDWTIREQAYKSQAFGFKLIDLKEDWDRKDEKALHQKLKKFWVFSEWFQKNDQVLEIFNRHEHIHEFMSINELYIKNIQEADKGNKKRKQYNELSSINNVSFNTIDEDQLDQYIESVRIDQIEEDISRINDRLTKLEKDFAEYEESHDSIIKENKLLKDYIFMLTAKIGDLYAKYTDKEK